MFDWRWLVPFHPQNLTENLDLLYFPEEKKLHPASNLYYNGSIGAA